MVPLEHADAKQLADVLAPFLSPQGKILAYSSTNTLIIKDQPSVVKMLIKAIKGKADLSECQNFEHLPQGSKDPGPEGPALVHPGFRLVEPKSLQLGERGDMDRTKPKIHKK